MTRSAPDARTLQVGKPPLPLWAGMLVTFFFPGAGFALVNRIWPTVGLFVVMNLLIGPFSRLLFAPLTAQLPALPRVLGVVDLVLFVLHLLWYKRAYEAQYRTRTDVRPELPWVLKLLGVWLGLAAYLVLRYVLKVE